jgi:hypothetical protein
MRSIKRKFVISGNFEQFSEFVLLMSPETVNEFVYLSESFSFIPRDGTVFLYGTWINRKDITKDLERLRANNCRILKVESYV